MTTPAKLAADSNWDMSPAPEEQSEPAKRAPKTASPPAEELRIVPIGELHESPLNSRKHYDQVLLEELAASLKQGQLTPCLVRPRAKGEGYEIGCGHRRYRAAKLAQLPSLECIVRPMDDKRFLEILTIENLQRDDLHPLEEAQGFVALIKGAGYDIARIAERVGRSTKYVYDRVKLLQLTAEVQKLFLDGRLTAGHAILLARLAPADQKRAIGNPKVDSWRGPDGGLFRNEQVDDELDLKDARTARSVRELQSWINDNIRFKPEALDPFLFPETAQVLAEAKEEDEKVVHITHDFRVPDGARDEKQRTYGEQSWKRADGKGKSKTCEHSVTGVVVAGPGRGEAFRICVEKKKCRIHWPAPKKSKSGASGKAEESWQERQRKQNERYERQHKEREIQEARWKKASPTILEALAARVKAAPTRAGGLLAEIILGDIDADRPATASAAAVRRGTTADDLVRHAAFLVLAKEIAAWDAFRHFPERAKAFGVDVRKILDEVVPVQTSAPGAPAEKKPEKKAAARKPKGKKR